MSVLFFKIHRAKSKSVPCYPFFNLLSKIRPSILLCQNPSPGTSGYLEKILPSGLQNLPSGRLRTALGQILESLGQDFFQNPEGRGWILYHSSPLHRNSRTKHVQTSSFYLRVPIPNLPSQVQVVVIFDAPRINSTFVGKFGNLN